MAQFFISYSRTDVQFLNQFVPLVQSKYGADCLWFDREIPGGDLWWSKIVAEIKICKIFIYLISNDTLASQYCQQELEEAARSNKQILPVVVRPKTNNPETLVHIQYVNMERGVSDKDAVASLFKSLDHRLRIATFRPYLIDLSERIEQGLNQIANKRINISLQDTLDAVYQELDALDRIFYGQAISLRRTEPHPFNTFSEAFEFYKGRVLLLGQPGAGKTVAILIHTLEAAKQYLDDSNSPFPLLVRIPDWLEQNKPTLEVLIANNSHGLNESQVIDLMASGRSLLLLDGLDELGNKAEEKIDGKLEYYDPRKRFLELLPANNHILVTCRVKDFYEIGESTKLEGAVTLQPLSGDQIQDYLTDNVDLWNVIVETANLRDVLEVPLMLRLFAEAYKDLGSEAQSFRNLDSKADIRDKIFESVVKQRYEHETRKSFSKPNLTIDDLNEMLGVLAVNHLLTFGTELEIEIEQLTDEDYAVIELAERLHLIRIIKENVFQFTHLLLRDYFGFATCIQYLSHPDSEVRRNIIFALGRLADERAINPLLNALNDDGSENYTYAANVVSQLINAGGDTKSWILTLESENTKIKNRSLTIAHRLDVLNEAAISPLVACLYDADEDVRWNAIVALSKHKVGKAVEPIIDIMLHDTNPKFRARAADSLRQIGDKRAKDSLLAAVDDEVVEVRIQALVALAEFEEPEAVVLAIKAAQSGDTAIRHVAISILGNLRAVSAMDLILDALNDEQSIVRYYAIRSLGKFEDINARQALVRGLQDQDRTVRELAADQLRESKDDSLLDLIIELIRDETGEVRHVVVEVLGSTYINNSRVVELLIDSLNDSFVDVRHSAARYLGNSKDQRSIQPLIEKLHDSERYVRSSAIWSLGELGDPQAVQHLIEVGLDLNYQDKNTRPEAARALGKIGDVRAVEPLISLLRDQLVAVRFSAAQSLGQIGDERAIEPLLSVLQLDDNQQVKGYVIEALRQLGHSI